MLNMYLKQVLGKDLKKMLKKVVIIYKKGEFTDKKEKDSHIMIDLSEGERVKSCPNFMSPIREGKRLPEYSQTIISNISSPGSSGVNPAYRNIFIEEPDFSHAVSPKNFSVLINSTKN